MYNKTQWIIHRQSSSHCIQQRLLQDYTHGYVFDDSWLDISINIDVLINIDVIVFLYPVKKSTTINSPRKYI